VTLFRDAFIVAVIVRLPLVVVMVKLAEKLPKGIVTVAGTFARFGLLLDRFTTNPPEGAGAESVTVPVEGAPPATVVGFTASEARVADAGGNTLIAADFVTEL
jgi:hypothetical protein